MLLAGPKGELLDNTHAPPPPLGTVAPLLDVAELARYLSLSVPAVRAELKRGKIPAKAILKLGRRIRFDPDAIRTWLETLRKAPREVVQG
jgi:excisionase family DNA binding protein